MNQPQSPDYRRGYQAGEIDECSRITTTHERVLEMAVLGAKRIIEAQANQPGVDMVAWLEPSTETSFGRVSANPADFTWPPRVGMVRIADRPVAAAPEEYIAAWLYQRLLLLPCLPHSGASRSMADTITPAATRSVQ